MPIPVSTCSIQPVACVFTIAVCVCACVRACVCVCVCSSVYWQVLLSIQGMILIPDPMYNEPGYERMRGTAEGNVSRKLTLEYYSSPSLLNRLDVGKIKITTRIKVAIKNEVFLVYHVLSCHEGT